MGEKSTMIVNDSEEIPIGIYQGGWRKVYLTLKEASPVPIHIEVVEK